MWADKLAHRRSGRAFRGAIAEQALKGHRGEAALCPTQGQEGSLSDLFNYRSKVEQPQDMVTGNPTVVGLVVRFYRNGRGQSALREILGRVVQDVLEDKTLSVHTDPVHLYKSWINQSEAQTGQRR